MFNIYRMLSLALQNVWVVKMTPHQIPISRWKNPIQQNFQFPHWEEFPHPLMLFRKNPVIFLPEGHQEPPLWGWLPKPGWVSTRVRTGNFGSNHNAWTYEAFFPKVMVADLKIVYCSEPSKLMIMTIETYILYCSHQVVLEVSFCINRKWVQKLLFPGWRTQNPARLSCDLKQTPKHIIGIDSMLNSLCKIQLVPRLA